MGSTPGGYRTAVEPSGSSPVSWPSMEALTALADAATIAEIATTIHSLFGPDAVLFAVDHAFDRLNDVVDGASSSALTGALRASLLQRRVHDDGEHTWLPIPERDHTTFAVRSAAGVDWADRDGELLVIGALLRDHRFRFEQLERARRRSAMSVAAELQWDLLPGRSDFFAGLRVAGVLEPAYDVAGDVFDYAVSDEGVWVYSFDGMGHGMNATLMSVVALASVRNARRRGLGLVDQMTAASRAVSDHWGGGFFVTAVGCLIRSDSIEFVNAGHEPVRMVVDGRVERLELTAELPLGVHAEHPYSIQRRPGLRAGDGIVMLSDGAPGSNDVNGSEFGADRLDATLEQHWSDLPVETADGLITDILAHVDGSDLTDDITVVVVRCEGSESVSENP